MIDSFEIRNFKMFDELKIDHLAPITLIGGKNNVGKSGLLEGLFMAAARDDQNLFGKLLAKRRISRIGNYPEGIWFPYFHNFDERNAIEIKTLFKSSERPEITKIMYERVPRAQQLIEIGSNASSYVHKLKIDADGHNFEQVMLNENIAISGYEMNSHRLATLQGADCPSSMEIFPRVAKVDEKNSIDELVKFIKILAPNVRDISAAPEGVLLDCGFKKKINASLSGEGVMRFLSIASIVIAEEPEIFLIDEIENGLHYSVLPKFWEALATLCREKNVQLIAATHSKECIEAAAQVMSDRPKEEFAFIRLQRDKKEKIVAVEMTAKDVCDMSQLEWEIR